MTHWTTEPKARRTGDVPNRRLTRLAFAVTLAVALAACGTSGGDQTAEISQLEDRIAELEQQLADATATTAVATTTMAALTTTTVEGTTTSAAVTSTSTAPTAQTDGAYTVENYLFSDVQVLEDAFDDFEIRARGTNNGTDRAGVSLTATLFYQGSVVATASALVSDWASGDTITVQFISTDDYGNWDAVEFQVDSEF